jgi:glycerol uptake facilitator protein
LSYWPLLRRKAEAPWGSAAFPSPGNYWWIPIVGPLRGGCVGGAAFQYLVRPFLPEEKCVDMTGTSETANENFQSRLTHNFDA